MMEFEIRISVGMTLEESIDSILEDSRKLERREKYIVNHLGVFNWKQFYELFSPKGLMEMESFVNSHNGEFDENMCEWQPKKSDVITMHTTVKKLGNSLGVSLPASLRKGRNIDVGTRVEIVESGSDLVITVRGQNKKVPTLKEMLAESDLNSEPHPDALAFESTPPVGQEDI